MIVHAACMRHGSHGATERLGEAPAGRVEHDAAGLVEALQRARDDVVPEDVAAGEVLGPDAAVASQVSEGDRERLSAAYARLKARAKSKKAQRTERMAIRAFRLPDPDLEPPGATIVRPASWSIVSDTVRIEALAWDNRGVTSLAYFLDADSLALPEALSEALSLAEPE